MIDRTDNLISDKASEGNVEVLDKRSENISLITAESRERQRMMGQMKKRW